MLFDTFLKGHYTSLITKYTLEAERNHIFKWNSIQNVRKKCNQNVFSFLQGLKVDYNFKIKIDGDNVFQVPYICLQLLPTLLQKKCIKKITSLKSYTDRHQVYKIALAMRFSRTCCRRGAAGRRPANESKKPEPLFVAGRTNERPAADGLPHLFPSSLLSTQ